MRLLRLVGSGEDGTSLLLETADGTEQFTLPIDERLRNVSSSDLPRLPVPESDAGKAPSPREIQTRVRAGESAQQVADLAGIPLDRVMRFAFPVLQERIRVIDEAKRARARHGNEGQLVDFGGLVDTRLARHGIDPTGVEWDSFRRPDGGWTVTAAFSANSEPVLAKFSFSLANRTVSGLNPLAADLLSDRPVQALLPPMPTPVIAPAEPVPAPEPPAASPLAGSGPVRLAAVPDQPEDGSAPTAAVRPGRRQKAHTRPIPLGDDDELFDQDAVDEPLRADPLLDPSWQEQPLPLDLGQDAPSDGHPDTGSEPRHRRGRRGEKPRMPSWDDILLGVRHKSD